MSKFKKKYYYLHTNGELFEKPKAVVESAGVNTYFESPYVAKWWFITTEIDFQKMIQELQFLFGHESITGIKISAEVKSFINKHKSKLLEELEV